MSSAAANANAQRRVCFSEMSSLVLIEPDAPAESDRKWYNAEERDGFRQGLVADVREMSAKLATTPMLDDEELCECVGMEAMLSRDMLVQTREYKANHSRCILAMQARQRRMNVQDDELLAQLSERSSAWAVARATTFAAEYWQSLKNH